MFNPGTKMTFIPYEHEGKRYFRADYPISETKILIDRDKAKKVRAELKAFLNYCEYMIDLAPAPTQHDWKAEANAERWLETIDWLVRNEGGDWREVVSCNRSVCSDICKVCVRLQNPNKRGHSRRCWWLT